MKKICSTLLPLISILLFIQITAQGDIVLTADGGFLFAGSVNEGSSGSDIRLIKYDKEKSIKWQVSYGTDNCEKLGGPGDNIAVTENGGFIVAAKSSPSKSSGSPGPSGTILVKLDSNGKIIWAKEFSKKGQAFSVSSIKETRDGGFIAAGRIRPIISSKAEQGVDIDAWAMKLDASGSVQWIYKYGGGLIDVAMSIITPREGGFLFVGETTGPKGKIGGGELWTVRLSKEGRIKWQKSYGEPFQARPGYFGVEWGYCVLQRRNGDYLVVGTTRSFGTGGGAR